jgi:asparagine synthase (glutamine-hydrolysing)
MSAIAGLLSFDHARVDRAWVEALTQRMADAGPDRQACWHSPLVSLGHALLQTRDDVFEAPQPLAWQDGQLRIVWDGRLDNREQLAWELPDVRGQCDSAIALAAYARWGEDCVHHFLGDFAFAVWNAQSGTLFCARDPMGARPFFFARTHRFFAFASEDEPLVTLPGVSTAIADDRVAHFLLPAFLGFDASRSWLHDVHALGGGERLTVHPNGRIERSTYWRFSEGEENRFSSDEECARAFRAVFEEAVRCRLPTQGDAALMLSGGLDSGSILGAADSLGFARLHTYSVISDPGVDCIE